jgi:hypothetical protein
MKFQIDCHETEMAHRNKTASGGQGRVPAFPVKNNFQLIKIKGMA